MFTTSATSAPVITVSDNGGFPVVQIEFNAQLADIASKLLPVLVTAFAAYQDPTTVAAALGAGFLLASHLENYRTTIDQLWAQLALSAQMGITVVTAVLTYLVPIIPAWVMGQHAGAKTWDLIYPQVKTTGS